MIENVAELICWRELFKGLLDVDSCGRLVYSSELNAIELMITCAVRKDLGQN